MPSEEEREQYQPERNEMDTAGLERKLMETVAKIKEKEKSKVDNDRLERIATACLSGLLGNPDRDAAYEGYARDSVMFAKALIDELEREGK